MLSVSLWHVQGGEELRKAARCPLCYSMVAARELKLVQVHRINVPKVCLTHRLLPVDDILLLLLQWVAWSGFSDHYAWLLVLLSSCWCQTFCCCTNDVEMQCNKLVIGKVDVS